MEFKTPIGTLKIYGFKKEGNSMFLPIVLDLYGENLIPKKIRKALKLSDKIVLRVQLKQYAIVELPSVIEGKSAVNMLIAEDIQKVELNFSPKESMIFDLHFKGIRDVPNIRFSSEIHDRPTPFVPVYPLRYCKVISEITLEIILPETLGLVFRVSKEITIPYKFGRSQSILFIGYLRRLLDMWEIEAEKKEISSMLDLSNSYLRLIFPNPITVKEGDVTPKIIPIVLDVINNEEKSRKITLSVALCYRVITGGKRITELIRPPAEMNVLVSGLRIVKELTYDIILEGKEGVNHKVLKGAEEPLICKQGKSATKLYFPVLITPLTWEFLRAFYHQGEDYLILGYPCFRFVIESNNERKSVEVPILFETV